MHNPEKSQFKNKEDQFKNKEYLLSHLKEMERYIQYVRNLHLKEIEGYTQDVKDLHLKEMEGYTSYVRNLLSKPAPLSTLLKNFLSNLNPYSKIKRFNYSHFFSFVKSFWGLKPFRIFVFIFCGALLLVGIFEFWSIINAPDPINTPPTTIQIEKHPSLFGQIYSFFENLVRNLRVGFSYISNFVVIAGCIAIGSMIWRKLKIIPFNTPSPPNNSEARSSANRNNNQTTQTQDQTTPNNEQITLLIQNDKATQTIDINSTAGALQRERPSTVRGLLEEPQQRSATTIGTNTTFIEPPSPSTTMIEGSSIINPLYDQDFSEEEKDEKKWQEFKSWSAKKLNKVLNNKSTPEDYEQFLSEASPELSKFNQETPASLKGVHPKLSNANRPLTDKASSSTNIMDDDTMNPFDS